MHARLRTPLTPSAPRKREQPALHHCPSEVSKECEVVLRWHLSSGQGKGPTYVMHGIPGEIGQRRIHVFVERELVLDLPLQATKEAPPAPKGGPEFVLEATCERSSLHVVE